MSTSTLKLTMWWWNFPHWDPNGHIKFNLSFKKIGRPSVLSLSLYVVYGQDSSVSTQLTSGSFPTFGKSAIRRLLLKAWDDCQSSLERWSTLVVKPWLLNEFQECLLLNCCPWHHLSVSSSLCGFPVLSSLECERECVFPQKASVGGWIVWSGS